MYPCERCAILESEVVDRSFVPRDICKIVRGRRVKIEIFILMGGGAFTWD